MLVFDFGGGTFDVSVLHTSENLLDVESTKGDSRLGGRDLDEVLLHKCIEKMKKDLAKPEQI